MAVYCTYGPTVINGVEITGVMVRYLNVTDQVKRAQDIPKTFYITCKLDSNVLDVFNQEDLASNSISVHSGAGDLMHTIKPTEIVSCSVITTNDPEYPQMISLVCRIEATYSNPYWVEKFNQIPQTI